MTPFPTLEPVPETITTERLLLRPYRFGDGEQVFAAIDESREHLAPWLDWPARIVTPEHAEDLCRRRLADWIRRNDLTFAIFERDSDRFIGATGLHEPNWRERIFEIGYFLRRSATGQGYMTEAVRAVADMGFATLRANRIVIRFDSRNTASMQVARRVGFACEGTLHNAFLDEQGVPRHDTIYARTDR